eukprot:CAMPEP_0198700460 /NCGR_PEP_ID=MMETSP1468-20131203/370432_1 /TAXON_ID=1461545 /ORGANISM="Mantoniella sp, Strain CCMP1436" /LENGTH=66 /DNA_ID=CAMNT_0044458401 /DNA_START=106 /DNA_END=304 /DNA_ORIENTATION=+
MDVRFDPARAVQLLCACVNDQKNSSITVPTTPHALVTAPHTMSVTASAEKTALRGAPDARGDRAPT